MTAKPSADWSELDPLLVMIEVRAGETHLILDTKALFGSEHPKFAWDALRSQLATGERAVAEPDTANRLRIRLPIPLRFRGGPPWFTDTRQAGERPPARRNPTLIAGLRNAHAILAEQGIDPATRKFDRAAQAPVQQYHRKLCLLALLAPDLQQAILDGLTPRHVTLQGLLTAAAPPLLWRE